MAQMTEDQRESFLAKTRQAILLTANADGTPNGLPLWFDWDGEQVRFFAGADSKKISRMEADPRISLLVVNDIDEPPAWVRFDGEAHVARDADANAFAVRLAERYWDLSQPGYAAAVDQWRTAPPGALAVVSVRPGRIRSSAE